MSSGKPLENINIYFLVVLPNSYVVGTFNRRAYIILKGRQRIGDPLVLQMYTAAMITDLLVIMSKVNYIFVTQ